MCGDLLLYVAQTKPMIDTVRAKKDRFRMKTTLECNFKIRIIDFYFIEVKMQ